MAPSYPSKHELFYRLRLPIIVSRGRPGRRNDVFLDTNRLTEFIDIEPAELTRLREKLGPPDCHPKSNKQNKINYIQLSNEYQSLIDAGTCNNFAGVAQHLHVSRAWVTKVMGRGRK